MKGGKLSIGNRASKGLQPAGWKHGSFQELGPFCVDYVIYCLPLSLHPQHPPTTLPSYSPSQVQESGRHTPPWSLASSPNFLLISLAECLSGWPLLSKHQFRFLWLPFRFSRLCRLSQADVTMKGFSAFLDMKESKDWDHLSFRKLRSQHLVPLLHGK